MSQLLDVVRRQTAAAILLASLGCHAADQVCTLLPCANGLTFTVADAPAGQVVVHATIPGTAGERVAECSGGSVCSAYFSDFTPASVTLVVAASGATRTLTVTPAYVTSQPNGPNCGTCRSATVAVAW